MFDIVITEDILLKVLYQGLAAGFIAPAFAMLFAVPFNCLSYIALGGFITRALRTFLVQSMHIEIVMATFIACAIGSSIFIYIAPKLGVPRPVFTVASIIALIPGVDGYNALLALMAIIDGETQEMLAKSITDLFHYGVRCVAIMISIALGIAIPPLFFYRYRYHHF